MVVVADAVADGAVVADALVAATALLLAPVALGVLTGLGVGQLAAAGRGGAGLAVGGLLTAGVVGTLLPLVPAPLLLSLGGVRLAPRPLLRAVAAVGVALSVVALLGVPLRAAHAAWAVPSAVVLAVPLVGGTAVGVASLRVR